MSLPEVRALSYTEELAPLWDVCVHFLEIKAVVRASEKTGRPTGETSAR